MAAYFTKFNRYKLQATRNECQETQTTKVQGHKCQKSYLLIRTEIVKQLFSLIFEQTANNAKTRVVSQTKKFFNFLGKFKEVKTSNFKSSCLHKANSVSHESSSVHSLIAL